MLRKRFKFLIPVFALLVFYGLGYFRAEAADLLLTPSSGEYAVGQEFSVTLYVDSKGELMNAASATVSFPKDTIEVLSVSHTNSIISYWVFGPDYSNQIGQVSFEGVVSNPGFNGSFGKVLTINFRAKREGSASVVFDDGVVLANDGLGTNILQAFSGSYLSIKQSVRPVVVEPKEQKSSTKEPLVEDKPPQITPEAEIVEDKTIILPVITEYSQQAEASGSVFVRGEGEPGATTKIVFKNTLVRSLGEKIIKSISSKKKELGDALVINDENGVFQYVSPSNLVAGVYNATPFLVDEETKTDRPGLGVQIFISDSQILKILATIINALGLVVPIVFLAMVIYFIPWYFSRRMKVLGKKLEFEEDQIEVKKTRLHKE